MEILGIEKGIFVGRRNGKLVTLPIRVIFVRSDATLLLKNLVMM